MLSKSPTGSGGEPSSPTRILTGRGSSAPFFSRQCRENPGSSLRASQKSAAADASGCTAAGTPARLRRPRLFCDASQILRRSFPDAVSFPSSEYRRVDSFWAYRAKVRGVILTRARPGEGRKERVQVLFPHLHCRVGKATLSAGGQDPVHRSCDNGRMDK